MMEKRQRLTAFFLFIVSLVCYISSSRYVKPLYEDQLNWQDPSTGSVNQSDAQKLYSPPIRPCTQQERLHHIKRFCEGYRGNFTEEQLVPSSAYLIDEKHHLLVGQMSKAGCTAVKQLLAEANGYEFTGEQLYGPSANTRFVHQRSFLHGYQVRFMDELSEADSVLALKDYYRLMLIRHPLDRLVSTYKGKILAPDSEFRYLPREILRMFHADEFARNKSLDSMSHPEKDLGSPSLTQFLTWIRNKKKRNSHWCTIASELHPCAVNWNALMRVETLEHDGHILLSKLKPDVRYDKFPVRHTHQNNSGHSHYRRKLPELKQVPDDLLQHFVDMYALDMEMFGYRWDRSSNTATCVIPTKYGPCC